jgi:2-dehydro-3-deoxygluconokinase
MVELAASRNGKGSYERRYGGDTLNTAVYLARLLDRRQFRLRYVTRLGTDPLSRWMINGWQAEGIDCGLVESVEGRLPGLYLIDTDERGERSFTYWRGEAPVRELFSRETDPIPEALETADALYTSGITLAILSERGREALLALMFRRKRAGAIVAFDTNYRARLWPNPAAARPWFEAAIAASTVCLPSMDDLASIFGESRPPDEWVKRLGELGAGEAVLKLGGDAVCTWREGETAAISLDRFASPVDTTGAGDSFNAGYLAARLLGRGVRESVSAGHKLASRVVHFPGAIIPREAMA